jgi:hypothetical protein
MDDETLVARLERLEVRLFAFEAVFAHVVAPVLLQTVPRQALALVTSMRTDLGICAPPDRPDLRLLAEEFVNRIADELERQLRAPKGAKATRSD